MSPTRALLAWLALLVVAGVAASFEPSFGPAFALCATALAFAAGADAALAWWAPRPEAERRVAPALAMRTRAPVTLTLTNPRRRALVARVHDEHPVHARSEGLPARVRVPPGARVELDYRLRPERRGAHAFGHVLLRIRSPLRLFERHDRVGAPEHVRALPDFRAVSGYQWLAAESRAGVLGIRRRPRRGEGLDFHQLREYRAGDSLRQIDWKTTARLRKAISREYQDERDQQVMFLLDCGRRMREVDGDRSHFDAALDAVLLLSHVALRQGDSVGLMTFAGASRWLAPRKGMAQATRILNAIHDLETTPRAADADAVARNLLARVRKRSLLVWVSNLRDDDAGELLPGLRLLARRHVVLLASLRESTLDAALAAPITDLGEALRVGSVHRYLSQRSRALHAARGCGAVLLDSEPAGLPVALVNGYLDVKAAGRL